MKTLKKSLALLLSAVMLFSTFAFVVANADYDQQRLKVNVQVTPPVAGKTADFTIKTDDNFVPGFADVLILNSDPVSVYEMCGKVPSTSGEYVEAMFKGAMKSTSEESPKDAKYFNAYYPAIGQMMKGGIAWIEYDVKDLQKLVDAGLADQAEVDAVMKDGLNLDFIGILLQSSSEYGYSFENIGGEKGKGISSSARIMAPGDKFKEGKSYMCWCEASIDLKAEAAEWLNVLKALEPYFKKDAEISKKLDGATEEEREDLNAQRDALKEEYAKDLEKATNIAKAVMNKVGNHDNYYPVVTVNGEKTEENRKSVWCAIYDFGEAEKEPTILDKIIEFFNSISEFFKNLFTSIKF